MHDPMTQVCNIKIFGRLFLTIWHVDPEKDGTDDSCDWFGGKAKDQQILEKITRDFRFNWCHPGEYPELGWFDEKGKQLYSTHSIALSMFRIAVNNIFGHWSKKANKFLQDNLADILFFAENSSDSINRDIENHWWFIGRHRFRERCKKNLDDSDPDITIQTPEEEQKVFLEQEGERMRSLAACIYSWILRKNRPWYKHPRYHFWHYKLQWHFLQDLRRRLFTRCQVCGKRFRGNEAAVSYNWESPKRRWFEWFRSEQDLRHMSCGGDHVVKEQEGQG